MSLALLSGDKPCRIGLAQKLATEPPPPPPFQVRSPCNQLFLVWAGNMAAPQPIWTKPGSKAEAPAGGKDMGGWTMKVFTEEQQARLGVDEEGKPSWGNLVGTPGSEAKEAIEAFNPELTVHEVPEDAMVTMDFREDRVRVFVGKDGKVAKPPTKG